LILIYSTTGTAGSSRTRGPTAHAGDTIMGPPEYEPRYLAGIVLFNRREFFEAHEVLEDLWNECPDRDRRFYQGLLQAAVGLYHFEQGNLRGATKLFRTGRAYMEQYPSPHLGLDRERFWADMERCFVGVHQETDLLRRD